MDINTEKAMDDDFDDSELALLDDDSEIDGDCNESQPCRGDESWLPQDLPEDVD